MDAINNSNLRHGRDGKTVEPGDHVTPSRRTVRHTDLKEWMAKNYPDQKPPFLFDETERNTHSAFNADSFRALQADRDASRVELEKKTDQLNGLRKEHEALMGERNSLRAMVERQSQPGERAEKTYLNVIGGLLEMLLGKSPNGTPYSSFETQDAIITTMLAYHEGKPGISKRNLESKFAEAKRSLASD